MAVCERYLLPTGTGSISLRDDWKGGSYKVIRSRTYTKDSTDVGIDDKRGNYIWSVVVNSAFGPEGGYQISSASAMSTADLSYETTTYMFSGDYSHIELTAIDHFGTFQYWATHSDGGGNLGNDNPWTINFEDNIIKDGDKMIWAYFI